MNCIATGKFFSLDFKKTEKGGYHELRLLQENKFGVNTEVFPVFDEDFVNLLMAYKKDDEVTIDLEVYVKNGYLQKRINAILDLSTGEKLA